MASNTYLSEPELLIDKLKAEKNIRNVLHSLPAKISFTPHFKTHQSVQVGRLFKKVGVRSIKVSSMEMAELFYSDGWNDITVAFPFYPGMLQKINDWPPDGALSLFVNSLEACTFLCDEVTRPVSVYIEIDSGYGRGGLKHHHRSKIEALIQKIHSQALLSFRGFYTHAGDSYQARTNQEILDVHERTKSAFKVLHERYHNRFAGIRYCSGDTPTASIAKDFGVINEISPGNLVYYDLMQSQIGSCNVEDIAVVLAAPIAEISPGANQVIVHGGAVHLSKDALHHDAFGTIYGIPVRLNRDEQGAITGWGEPMKGCYVKSLSQEHGVLHIRDGAINQLKWGVPLGILPVHSCLAVDAMITRQRSI